MSRVGVLQTDLGPDLLEEVKREAEGLGLTASSYVRMLVKRRRFVVMPLSEKGGSKKGNSKRPKMTASSR
jgi:hypothetical protein